MINYLIKTLWLTLFLSSVRSCLIPYFDARKFWCIFVLAIFKTNPFSHHLSKCNFIQNLDSKRYFVYLWKDSNDFFNISSHNINLHNANFSKLMRTIHISMTTTFQCEDCQCFTFKICAKFKLKCITHGGMYSAHYFGKIRITSKQ